MGGANGKGEKAGNGSSSNGEQEQERAARLKPG